VSAREQPIAVCLFEIQQFQSIIGSFGHAAGDEVLSEVGRRLTALQRPCSVGHIERTVSSFCWNWSVATRSPADENIIEKLRGSFDYSGHLAGREVLVRWHHPTEGFPLRRASHPPPRAEGAIRALTAWAVARALRDLRA
jgi:predicted signal transduction protein with EAL and GGDEF domain